MERSVEEIKSVVRERYGSLARGKGREQEFYEGGYKRWLTSSGRGREVGYR